MTKGKKYVAALGKLEKGKVYSVDEAIKLIKETTITKFDSSVELAMNLNLDTKKVDQQLRGAIVLPHGTGKSKKVLVIAKGEQAKLAKEAGADYVGDADMLTKIEKENWFDFDTMIATPDMMIPLSKLGKILGPRGLMPNPKTGTVTTDVTRAINDVKKGRVEYRTDTFGNIHGIVGKVSFDDAKLKENLKYFVEVILKLKPSTVKGSLVKTVTVTTTMGPGIRIDINSFDK